jgi:hypothetical protein
MKLTPNNEGSYTANGYKDREDYLDSLADDRGIDRMAVDVIADVLGEGEDFDGLVGELEGMEYLGLLDSFRTETTGGDDESE